MYTNDDNDSDLSFPTIALRYTVMVLAMTVGISILLSAAYGVHPMMLLSERVNDLVAGLR